MGIYDTHLDKNEANYGVLTPILFLERTAFTYPDYTAVVHGQIRLTWEEVYERSRRLGAALEKRGLGQGDTIAWVGANTPETFEAHFGVPMMGGVLNAINYRLDAAAIAFILEHGESKILFVDPEFAALAKDALALMKSPIPVIDIEDKENYPDAQKIGDMTYDELLATGDPDYAWKTPEDEWQAITLNYTSGTTGNPKGVVYHHRGAYLNGINNIVSWDMGKHPVYLWTLPMFHCNGWCFPWTLAAAAGTNVCLRAVRVEPIFEAFKSEKVTHFCGAPIVLSTIYSAPDDLKKGIDHKISTLVAAAPPPATVIENMDKMGVDTTHVYGLTETYGPAVLCEWKSRWDSDDFEEKAKWKSRQGVKSVMLDDLMVANPDTMEPVPRDGKTMGEIMFRGNIVMKGYLKNPSATEEAFKGGWFHSGDLAVWHPDGYIQIQDRSKDIIISGGENISSIEVEGLLYKHPAVQEAAVIGKQDEKWGEVPCAFITLKEGASVTEEEMTAFCRENMAGFKIPKAYVFGPLPKTSTGKIQKFKLREQLED